MLLESVFVILSFECSLTVDNNTRSGAQEKERETSKLSLSIYFLYEELSAPSSSSFPDLAVAIGNYLKEIWALAIRAG